MKTFREWITSLGNLNNSNYAAENGVLEQLQWLWRDYCDATFMKATPPVSLPSNYIDEKVKGFYDAQAAPDAAAKKKAVAGLLNAFSEQLIATYRKDNIPSTDNDTLCIYHAFSHVTGVPAEQKSALVLCTLWKTDRFVADLAYDDDRCLKMMALKYGFTKWSTIKGDEILSNYKTVGTELIISIYQATSKIPVKYWTDGAWHNKQFDIEGNVILNQILEDPGTYGHAVFAKVERSDLIKFFDNKNNSGRSTTQIQPTAKPLRCLVYSKPPA